MQKHQKSKPKKYYNQYCKILSKVIKEAKKLKYDKKIQNSKNENETIWEHSKTRDK
jgi:hypothetical protein